MGFKSLTEHIDPTTPGGKLLFHIFGSIAEFERDLIRERTQAGFAAPRARGRRGGRPKAFAAPRKLAMARTLLADKQRSIPDICKTLGVSSSTLYRYLAEQEAEGRQPVKQQTTTPRSATIQTPAVVGFQHDARCLLQASGS